MKIDGKKVNGLVEIEDRDIIPGGKTEPMTAFYMRDSDGGVHKITCDVDTEGAVSLVIDK